MYPYRSFLGWAAAGRHAHLLKILGNHPLPPQLRRHPRRLKVVGKVRMGIVLLLSLTLLTTITAVIARLVPALDEVHDGLGILAAYTGGFTTLLGVLLLAANHVLSLLEVDIMAVMAKGD